MKRITSSEQNNFDSDSDDDEYFQEENFANNQTKSPKKTQSRMINVNVSEDIETTNNKPLNTKKQSSVILSTSAASRTSNYEMDPVAHQRLHAEHHDSIDDTRNHRRNENSIEFNQQSTSSSVPVHEQNDLSSTTTSSMPHISPMSSLNEDRMRRKLQFFFMNPIEKWQAKRKFPYKFVIQLIKIVIVTIQLCLFAHSRYNHINYTWDNRVAFSHLFLRGWDDASEVQSYPPAKGPFALYMKDDFYDTIDFALNGYANLSEAIGSYSYRNEKNEMEPLKLCVYHYKECNIFAFNESYYFDPEIEVLCLDLPKNVTETGSKIYLKTKDINVDFDAFYQATVEFSVKTVNFKGAGLMAPPECYQFDIGILFDNRDHDGQMLLSLDATPIRLHCKGDTKYIDDSVIDAILQTLLNLFVIGICAASLILCARALYRAEMLRKQTDTFFRVTYNRPLDDHWAFINLWYVMIIINDILLIFGSIIKEMIERRDFQADQWNICSVLLGIGNLLVWFGVLRYFSFFKTYNVVILTLKCAAPKIYRF